MDFYCEVQAHSWTGSRAVTPLISSFNGWENRKFEQHVMLASTPNVEIHKAA